MAQIILGLDLGTRAVKAVLLESSYRGFAVRDQAEVVLPPGAEGASLRSRQGAAVASLLAERGWHPDGCVVAFPGASLAAHVITLPFTDVKRISQTLAFEVEAQIPFELSEAAWDWQSLGVRGSATDLWVAVAPRPELAELLAALVPAGLDPFLVVPAAPTLAALRAAGALPETPPLAGEPVPCEAILDLGEGRAQLCVFQGGALAAARTWSFGVAWLIRGVAADLGVTEVEAAARLAEGTAGEALTRALVPLVRELRTTLRAWRARVGHRPLARLWLAGGVAGLQGLSERLAAEVDGPVEPLTLVGPASTLPPDRAGSLALALAAALRGHLGAKAGRLNLRRGDLSYTRDFEHVKGKVARLAVAAGAVLLLAIASQIVNVFALSRQEAAVDRALCDAEEKVMKKCYSNYEEAISVLRGRGVPGATIPKVSAVDVLDDLSRRLPDGVPLRLERIEIGEKKVHLQGIADTAEQVDRLVAGLHGSKCFTDARSGGARKRGSDGKFEFSIDSALTCPEPGQGGE